MTVKELRAKLAKVKVQDESEVYFIENGIKYSVEEMRILWDGEKTSVGLHCVDIPKNQS